MMMIFSSLAWNNIGHINWEPWLPQVREEIFHPSPLNLSLDLHTVTSRVFTSNWEDASLFSGLFVFLHNVIEMDYFDDGKW